MHKVHIAITLFGIFAALFVGFLYYWSQGRRLAYKSLGITLMLGVTLGVAELGALYSNFFIFILILAAYCCYFLHVKNHLEFNAVNESSLVALFMGILIGVTGFFGCLFCMG